MVVLLACKMVRKRRQQNPTNVSSDGQQGLTNEQNQPEEVPVFVEPVTHGYFERIQIYYHRIQRQREINANAERIRLSCFSIERFEMADFCSEVAHARILSFFY